MKGISPYLLFLFLYVFLSPVNSFSQQSNNSEEVEHILLELDVQRVLTFDFEGLLSEDSLFIPVQLLLEVLEISFTHNSSLQKIHVRLQDKDNEIVLDFIKGRINGHSTLKFLESNDYIIYNRNIYIKKELAEKVFNIILSFDYQNLKIYLDSSRDLPAVKNYKRQRRYQTFSQFQNPLPIDKVVSPRYHLFNGWVADWVIGSSHSRSYHDYYYNFGLGGQILGGSVNLYSRGSQQNRFSWNDSRWNWQLPFYATNLLSKITLGDQSHEDILGSGYLAYQGLSITNSPKSPRRNFDTLHINRTLPKEWDAEFYINNRLAQIARGNEEEQVKFSLPLRYGSNTYSIHYFNNRGGERIEAEHILIPANLLPKDKVEYTLTAGRYRSIGKQLFSRGELKWGLSQYITLGGGVHYLDQANESNTFIPFAQTWFRVGRNLYLHAIHAQGYYSGGMFNYTFPNMSPLRMSYKHFHNTSPYNRISKKSEATFNTSLPVYFRSFRLSTYFSVNYSEYLSNDYLSLYSGLTTQLPYNVSLRVSNNIGIYNIREKKVSPSPAVQISELHFSRRFFRKYLIKPYFQYDHLETQFSNSGIEINTTVFKEGNLSLQYNRNFITGYNSFLLRFTINLDKARHSSQVNISRNQPNLYQSTGGAIALNSGVIHTDKRSWLNKSALEVEPYLDYNNNNKKEKNEPLISGLEMNIFEESDSNYPVNRNNEVVAHLTPYEDYTISIDKASLDNPLWSPSYSTYKITVLPNMVNKIQVPIQVNGEIEGYVYSNNNSSNLNGLKIYIKDDKDMIVDSTLTYSDGSFFVVGLKPGTYTAELDSTILEQNFLRSKLKKIDFQIRALKEGDIVSGLNFLVFEKSTENYKSGSEFKEHEDSLSIVQDYQYSIQVGAFRDLRNAVKFSEEVQNHTSLKSYYSFDDKTGLYLCQVGAFNNKNEAWEATIKLRDSNKQLFESAHVIPLDH